MVIWWKLVTYALNPRLFIRAYCVPFNNTFVVPLDKLTYVLWLANLALCAIGKRLTFILRFKWVFNPLLNNPVQQGQYHFCWCLGSLCRRDISLCYWLCKIGRILSATGDDLKHLYYLSVSRNDRKCMYIRVTSSQFITERVNSLNPGRFEWNLR